MQLCREFHLSPRELGEIDIQTILDWVTILGQEAQIIKEQQPRG